MKSLWCEILPFAFVFLNGCGVGLVSGVPAEYLKGYEELAQKAEHFSTVMMYYVGPPLKHILLVRRGQEVCALRFTELHQDTSGLVAHYEWWSLKNESTDFKPSNVERGSGIASFEGAMGMAHTVFFTIGSSTVQCGVFELDWSYPTSVHFILEDEDPPKGKLYALVELAPTKWRNIRHVKTDDPSLHWFHFGEEYSLIERRVPANKLPGSPSGE